MTGLINFAVKVTRDNARIYNAVDKKVDGAYRYIGGALRRNARNSIRKGSKTKPHSLPGKPINSRSGIYKNTIERDYNPRTKLLIVGPKTTAGRKIGNKTLPRALEYGVRFRENKPTYIPASRADGRARTIAWKKLNQKRKNKGRKRIKKSELKWVIIPPGSRVIDARPTMRLAMNKTVTSRNLKTAFDRTRINPILRKI